MNYMARGIHVFENFCSFFLLCIGVFLEGQTILVVFFYQRDLLMKKNKKVLLKFWTPHVRSHTHVVVVVVVVGEQVVLVSSLVFTNSF